MNALSFLTRITLALGIAASSASAAGEAPITKPKDDKPIPFKTLVKEPDYKRAPLLIQPGSPLSPRTFEAKPGETSAKTAWEWHKNAMHLKALKRSGQDHPHLGATIAELSDRQDADIDGKLAARDPRESGFEAVDILGDDKPAKDDPSGETRKDNLSIFRFTNMGSFINGNDPIVEKKPGKPDKLIIDPKRTEALRAAIALGKAFFWDPKFSSDKKVACASCHYASGADQRTRGVVSLPANLKIHAPWPETAKSDSTYEPYDLTAADLVSGSPEIEGIFARGLFDPRSLTDFQVREVIGSLGVQRRYFEKLNAQKEEVLVEAAAPDAAHGGPAFDPLLKCIHDIERDYRQVTPRNAGTVVNAVFNSRNFHDSRASMVFNGHTGWGEHTDEVINRSLYVWKNVGGKLVGGKHVGGTLVKARTWSPAVMVVNPQSGLLVPTAIPNADYIANAALASQAVEPIVSDVEMSSLGRMFHHIARRMLDKPILDGADIDPTDSSLGTYRGKSAKYEDLIKAAFKDAWWISPGPVSLLNTSATTKDGKFARRHWSQEETAARALEAIKKLKDEKQAEERRAKDTGTAVNWPEKKAKELKLAEEHLAARKAAAMNHADKLFYDDDDFGGYSQMEANFGLFWGLALHLYQSTLISDHSKFDTEQLNVKTSARASSATAAMIDPSALKKLQPLDASARRGFDLFRTVGCSACHTGAEFTAASISEIGLLRALGDNGTAAVNLFAAPADPLLANVLDDEVDIVAGALLCPPEKPLGVECMDLGGRMESVYDGGNYVIGASRFIRLPSWPDSPPVANADVLKKLVHPNADATAMWEDSGNGNYFVPNEPDVVQEPPLSVTMRRKFGLHLLDPTHDQPPGSSLIAQLMKALGCEHTPGEINAFTAGDLADLGTSAAELNLSRLNHVSGTKAGADRAAISQRALLAQPKALENAALREKVTQTFAIAQNAAQSLTKTDRPALNSTQNVRRLSTVGSKAIRVTAQDPARGQAPAPGAPPQPVNEAAFTLSPAAMNERNLTLVNGSPLVTPATPVPPSSLARRWFESLSRAIVTAQDQLKKAEQDGDQPAIVRLKRQIDALLRLQSDAERVADGGAFKVPTLRNIELTGPYMHNGSLLTLEAVVDFYARGGDYNRRVRANEEDIKTGDLHPEMAPIPLSTEQKADLVAFLKTLTDERVRDQAGPFDHPSLEIPSAPESSAPTFKIEATGRAGGQKVQSFEQVLGSK